MSLSSGGGNMVTVEQSVANLMGEIGKHIEGQLRAGAGGSGQIDGDSVATVTTTTSDGEAERKGK